VKQLLTFITLLTTTNTPKGSVYKTLTTTILCWFCPTDNCNENYDNFRN